jgi:hypothetical protein
MPAWQQLGQMLAFTVGLPDAPAFAAEHQAIIDQRALLNSPDPVAPLLLKVTDALRTALNVSAKQYAAEYSRLEQLLSEDQAWKKLTDEQRQQLLRVESLSGDAKVDTSSPGSILSHLSTSDLNRWRDRTAALSGRFERVRQAAAQLLMPKTVKVTLPGGLFQTEADVRQWLADVEARLLDAIKKHPIQL